MSDGIQGTQVAVYDRLIAAGIAGGRVYDDVPQEVTFPYVQIGDSIAEEHDLDTLSGTTETLTIFVYSRHNATGGARGFKEVKDIMSEIKGELHNTVLDITGRSALIWWAGTLTRLDNDGLTRQGIIRLLVSSYQ